MQEPLRAISKAEMERLLATISDAVWSAEMANGAIRYRYFSAGVEPITGYPSAHFLDAGDRWLAIVDPEDRATRKDAIARLFSGESEQEDVEYRLRRSDGAVRWVRDNIRVSRPADGRVLLDGVISDVEERKSLERALREGEERMRSLASLSSDWYWRQDADLRFTYLSNEVAALAGYSAASSMGKSRWDLTDITPLSCSWAEHRATLAARRPFRDFEYCRVDATGSRRYISVSGAPVFDQDGRFDGYQGVARNITEQKSIEEELRARQEMLDLAQKVAGAVAFDWQLTRNPPMVWSPELEAVHGLAPGTGDDSFATWRRAIDPADWPQVEEGLKKSLESGEIDIEYRVPLAGGKTRWLQARARVFFDESAKPVRSVGLILDITARKQGEEDFRRLERQLRQSQRLESLGTLAGGIAHDFNNILGIVLGYGELALQRTRRGSRLRGDLDNIMAAGERGRSLVDRILLFSRNSAGDRELIHVESIVREVLDLLSTKLPGNIVPVTRLSSGNAAIYADATQLHQILTNLVTNATHAMPTGGKLSISLDTSAMLSRSATTGPLEAGDYVLLNVTDSGTGISRRIIDRIFDPFFTTKGVGAGTGLGLSLVHGIVSDLGGAVDVQSQEGAGSSFTVFLPCAGEASPAAPDTADAAPRGSGQHILLVDDEVALVRLAEENLRALGYRVTSHTSGTSALRAFAMSPTGFDAVITDERMPDMNGTALIREIRSIRPQIPILLVTGYPGNDPALASTRGAADDVLRKPLLAGNLATSLAQALRIER